MIINRLSKETSPYLQQHAENPVEWYPWGKEALDKAKIEKKPILLSIGYSACHWCHVMAHESFEDIETAKIMNEYFINIKVDREERPDLDKIYQTSQMLLNQRSGGWPLTMFLTHENQVPFFGGTYFPNTAKYNLPSFSDLLVKINEYYKNNYKDILDQNQTIIQALENIHKKNKNDEDINKNIDEIYMEDCRKSFDHTMGGFGSAPKFPQTTVIMHIFNSFLYQKKQNEKYLDMAFYSLIAMQEGGINDQIGGGFFRYSVDDVWMIPHFEKMLYDNACLLECYCKGYFISKNKSFFDTAKKTADWLINEMQSSEGGFFSSIDADTSTGEGEYYIWEKEEIKNNLNKDQYKEFSDYFGINKKTNFENKYHLYVSYDSKKDFFSRIKNYDKKLLADSINTLFKIRNKKEKPFVDKKILTSWNALAINSLIEFYKISKNVHYLNKAEESLHFIIEKMIIKNNLNATYKDGKSHIKAYLDDYAFLINSILNFISIKWDSTLLKNAIFLSNLLVEKFLDKEDGGFFFTANDHESLIQNPKPTADESFPAGNSVAAKALIKLGFLMNNTKYIDAAHSVFSYASKQVNDSPNAHSSLIDAYLLTQTPYVTVILKGNIHNDEIKKWLDVLSNTKKTNMNYFHVTDNNTGYANIDDKITKRKISAFICTDYTCEAPITNFEKFVSRISIL